MASRGASRGGGMELAEVEVYMVLAEVEVYMVLAEVEVWS